MKKKLLIIAPIILIVILITFISMSKQSDPIKTAENFLETYYSFSKEDVVERKGPSDNEKLAKELKKSYQKFAWDECIDMLITNRYYDQILQVYSEEGNNLVFKQAELEALDKGKTSKTIENYNYICDFSDKKSIFIAKGQLSLEKRDNVWKVKSFIIISTDKG